MGTFGVTTIGENKTPLGEYFKRTSQFAAPTCGLEKLSIYLEPVAGKSGTGKYKGIIYRDEGGKPGKKVATSNELTLAAGFAAGWKDLVFPSVVGLLAGTYWIGLMNSGTEEIAYFTWNNVTNTRARNLLEGPENYEASGNPKEYQEGGRTSFGEYQLDEKQISIYGTYGAAPAPTVTKPADQSTEVDLAVALQVVATTATLYSATGLPPGLTINPATGLISGTPTAVAGATTATIKVEGPGGAVETTFKWTITTGTKFGNGYIGTNIAPAEGAFKRASLVTAPGCKATKISVYFAPGTGVGTQKIKAIIYAMNSEGNGPGKKIAVSEEKTFTNGGFTAEFFNFTIVSGIVIKGGKYWVGFISAGVESVVKFAYESIAESRAYNADETETTTGGTDPFGEHPPLDDRAMSVYVTYEAAPAPTFTKPADQSSEQNTTVFPAFQLTYTNVEKFNAGGTLPAGLTVNAYGEISGKATAAPGVYTVKMKAEGINGETVEREFKWTVVAASPSYEGWSASNPPPASTAGRPGSATSPFNQLVGQTRAIPNSDAMVKFMLEKNLNRGPSSLHSDTEGARPLFFAKNSDPVVEIKRNPFGEAKGKPANPLEGRKIHLPAAAKPEGYSEPPATHEGLKAEGGSDRHMTVVLAPVDAIKPGEVLDFYQVWVEGGVLWFTNGGPTEWKGNLTAVEPASGNAAGFLDNAGQITVAELKAGVVPHALVADASENRNTFVYPANHSDGSSKNVNAQPMGQRFKLNYTEEEIKALKFAPWKEGILLALVRYGFYITDSGSPGLFLFQEGGELMYQPFTGEEPLRKVAEEQQGFGDGSILNEGPFFLFKIRDGIDWTRLVALVPPPQPGFVVPSITTPATQTTVEGTNVSLALTSTNVQQFEAINLPPGLSISAGSGTISGKPTAHGHYKVTIIGKGHGTEVETSFEWIINSSKLIPGATGNAIYDALQPLAYADESLGYPLLKLCDAFGVMWDDIDKIIRDKILPNQTRVPGYSSVMNLAECPEAWLPWLAQFTGTQAPPNNPVLDRELIVGAEGMHRGTVEAVENKAKLFLTGQRRVSVFERFGGKAYKLLVVVFESETKPGVTTEILKRAIEEVLPAGMILTVVIASSWIYQEVPPAETTYKKTHEDYATYKGLATHQIGK